MIDLLSREQWSGSLCEKMFGFCDLSVVVALVFSSLLIGQTGLLSIASLASLLASNPAAFSPAGRSLLTTLPHATTHLNSFEKKEIQQKITGKKSFFLFAKIRTLHFHFFSVFRLIHIFL